MLLLLLLQKGGVLNTDYELCIILVYLWLFSSQSYVLAFLLGYAADGIWGLSLYLVIFSGSSKGLQRVSTGRCVNMGCGTLEDHVHSTWAFHR